MDLTDTAAARPIDTPHAPLSANVSASVAFTDYERALNWIEKAVSSGRRGYVCVAGTHTVTAAREDPALRAAIRAADFAVPDGQPLVWALSALGHPLERRIYGPDLMDRACARAAHTGQRFYVDGGRDAGALAELARRLRRRQAGAADRRRRRAAASRVDGRRGGGHSSRHRPLRPGCVGWHRRAQAKEVDGAFAGPPGGLGPGGRRRGVRLPRWDDRANHSVYSRPGTLSAIAARATADCVAVDRGKAFGSAQVFASSAEIASLVR